MPPFKDSFQDRVGRAAEAKQKALDKLRAKAPIDPEIVAARLEASRQKEAKAAEKRAAKAAEAKAAEEARATEESRQAEEAAAAAAAAPKPLTEAERKAARDARYAARKNRK